MIVFSTVLEINGQPTLYNVYRNRGLAFLNPSRTTKAGIGPLKASIKPEMYDGYRHLMEEVQTGYKPAAGADLLNFSQGFKAGAAYYFKQAKPPAPPKKH